MPVLRIDIESRFADFQDSLNRIQRQTAAAAQQMQTAFSGVGRTLAGLGVGISVVGITAFAKSAIDSAAALDDLSEKTGASVEELSKLEQVANIGGHSFDAIGDSLVRLSKAINSTDEESKGAGKALAALGLSAQELRGLDTAEALKRVAVELNKFADGSGKSALAVALLGKSGAEALPFLKDLATEQGISARVTTQQAAAAEELQKSLGRLRNEVSGAAQAIGRELIPVLTTLIAQFNAGREAGQSFFTTLFSVASVSGKEASDPGKRIKELSASLESLEAQRQRLSNLPSLQKAFSTDDIAILDAQIKATRGKIEALKPLQRELAAALSGGDTRGEQQRFGLAGAQKPQVDFAPTATTRAGRTAKTEKDPFDELLKKADDTRTKALIDQLKDIEEKEKEGIHSAEEFQRTLDNLISNTSIEQTRKMQESVDFLNKALELGRISPELYSQAIESLLGPMQEVDDTARRISSTVDSMISQTPIERAKELQAVIDELNRRLEAGVINADQFEFALSKALDVDDDKLKKTNDAAKELGLTFSSAFEDAVVEGKKFSDVLKGLEKDILRILTRKLVTEPLAEKASGFIGSLTSGSGGGFGDVFGSLFGKIFGQASGGVMTSMGPMALQRYAFGGVANSPQFAVFGEGSQNEAFVPLPDGRRIPVDIQGGGGARIGTFVQNISVSGNPTRQTQLQLATAAGQGVQRALDRNG